MEIDTLLVQKCWLPLHVGQHVCILCGINFQFSPLNPVTIVIMLTGYSLIRKMLLPSKTRAYIRGVYTKFVSLQILCSPWCVDVVSECNRQSRLMSRTSRASRGFGLRVSKTSRAFNVRPSAGLTPRAYGAFAPTRRTTQVSYARPSAGVPARRTTQVAYERPSTRFADRSSRALASTARTLQAPDARPSIRFGNRVSSPTSSRTSEASDAKTSPGRKSGRKSSAMKGNKNNSSNVSAKVRSFELMYDSMIQSCSTRKIPDED